MPREIRTQYKFIFASLTILTLSWFLCSSIFLTAQDQDNSSPGNEESLPADPKAPTSDKQSNPSKPSSIPPELLRQIQKLPEQPQTVVVAIPRLGTTARLLLLLLAVIVIFASIIICRFISCQNYFDGQTSVFLLLGLFGAIAALVIATACVGSLYLHLAAAICTIISGFCLMAFLFPQFELTRQLLTGTPEQSDADKQNLKVKNLPGETESEGEPI